MNIGISGAHRTGKTTLCNEYCYTCKTNFLGSNAAGVLDDLKLDAADCINFDVRMYAQNKILSFHEELWEFNKNFITDRTPLDFAMYTLFDTDVSEEHEAQEVDAYISRCIEACNKYFDDIFVLQPGIPIVQTKKNTGKQDLETITSLNSIMLSIIKDTRLTTRVIVIPEDMLNISARVDAIRGVQLLWPRK